ncbi:MAG: hypothetical protein NVS3B10_23890 [Polyangiales bacterium]
MNAESFRIDAPPSARSTDLRALTDRTDEELDTLGYGVIALDREGTILRYNLAEARFARLDRNQVLNKNFFRTIAPCTATPAFHGRFLEFVRDGNVQPLLKFPYVFDFRFGAQEVEVELVRTQSRDVVYLCVNRQKLLPVRKGSTPVDVAPLQAELAPDESQLGIARDAGGRRLVQVTAPFLEALHVAANKVAPEVWPRLSEEWGFAWGRRVVIDLEAEALESFDSLLRDLPMVTVVESLGRAIRAQGWGQLAVDFGEARHGIFVLTLTRNAWAESLARGTTARCGMFAGFFRAVLGHLSARRLVVGEAQCVAKGDPACAFVVAAEARAAILGSAIEAHGGDLAALARAMGG